MKQVLQNLSNGETILAEVPVPLCGAGELLIETRKSLISIGTERMLVEFGRANLISKARHQPEKVKMVLEKIKTDGFLSTIDAVRSKLDQPIPLGYSNVGIVLEVGSGVKGFQVGDRVVSNGHHAEIVVVPQNLCARVPDDVSDEQASFTVLGAIGLEGIRLASPTLGEHFVVIGLGLIGLLTVQLLRANGCRVLGIDIDRKKLEIAKQFGAETISLATGADPVEAGIVFSRGRGVDGVIITAATASSEPISQAARMCRKRGRIVLVGVTGLKLNRSDFYEKELSFQVSCSYGPGRYDPEYEQKGIDYPVGYVRWTEQRNFEAVLDMMAQGRINIEPLISKRFRLEEAVVAYDELFKNRSVLGIMLDYVTEDRNDTYERIVLIDDHQGGFDPQKPVCAFIGAGNYASRILIPAFERAGAQFHTIVSRGGVTAFHHGKRAGFKRAATDSSIVFETPEINMVVVATRHNSHAHYVIEAIKAGKNVFVEKPLCLNSKELEDIIEAYQASEKPRVMVGFNRRFAPHVEKMKELLHAVQQPKVFLMTMNAGRIPADSWIQDREIGGGRIIGEACHYVDLMRYLAGCKIVDFHAGCIGRHPAVQPRDDKAVINLFFADGSFGTIHYLANGGKTFPKERIEVFAGDAVLQLDNFRRLRGFGWKGFRSMHSLKQDKGQVACAKAFLESIRAGAPSPIPFAELVEVSKVCIEVAELLQQP